MKDDVIKRIRELRIAKGWTQENLADELKIVHSSYSKIETGKTDPNVTRLLEIATVLNVPVTAFFGTENADNVLNDPKTPYANSNKDEIDKLSQLVQLLSQKIESLQTEISELKKPVKGKKKG